MKCKVRCYKIDFNHTDPIKIWDYKLRVFWDENMYFDRRCLEDLKSDIMSIVKPDTLILSPVTTQKMMLMECEINRLILNKWKLLYGLSNSNVYAKNTPYGILAKEFHFDAY